MTEPSCLRPTTLQARRPRIFVALGTYLPGYKAGGPIRSLANLVDVLKSEFEFYIVTGDRDTGDTKPYSTITPDEWTSVGGAEVFYTSARWRNLKTMQALVHSVNPELLYLNSFFSPNRSTPFLLLHRLNLLGDIPVLVAPRGEFSPGALELKRTKKQLYIALSKVGSIANRFLWHATTQDEAYNIHGVLSVPCRNIKVAPNIASRLPSSLATPDIRHRDGILRVAFYSRVSPKKNLDFALKVLTLVRARVKFNIYGPIEDRNYWRYCLRTAEKLPENIVVEYCGAVYPEDVHKRLMKHDIMFLPTKGENFGHVIAESLSSGVPVLISDTTPWRDLARHGIGWDLPLQDPQRFAHVIESCAADSPERRSQRRNACKAYAARLDETEDNVGENRELLYWAMEGSPH